MNKQDWIWVAMKVFGLYSLVRAMTSLLSLIHYLNYMVQAGSWSFEHHKAFYLMLGTVIVYCAVGLYLLKGGKALLAWITPPEVSVET